MATPLVAERSECGTLHGEVPADTDVRVRPVRGGSPSNSLLVGYLTSCAFRRLIAAARFLC